MYALGLNKSSIQITYLRVLFKCVGFSVKETKKECEIVKQLTAWLAYLCCQCDASLDVKLALIWKQQGMSGYGILFGLTK